MLAINSSSRLFAGSLRKILNLQNVECDFNNNKTCKTKLQYCVSHFTILLGLHVGVTDVSASANS